MRKMSRVFRTCGGDQTHIDFSKIELSLNVKGSLEEFLSSS